ncbi:MAG: hypothetical protein A3I77_00405 [Gammaproteobacteria bacterium RIFCSPLOWO2_02_FULL_42_14]|nr:MAG: hypothetical protein A3B71_08490 [Gammaproteobacteria bacterium RIFCSPHIGHO2_02_FULL_42_43]OGT50747.1 MAG: hypothetical protein A3E54_00685 [Gammaproteobacteria bacterium RIFCSPHIGHO2_12_FULL_41_25]OGT61732.1 MAG: hypothetical protein A3I77_00405 [Gammaproteobacteria bacterium RIFCSPLOWO2_02_FULL_42_14]OGT85476.1 MAG: hypothetical protein A3G86_06595 [Gammaproteobacteria bacterium RIFCSPLOWO2_12_FULL_42_18]
MKRELLHRLKTWKLSSHRKPMLVMGARQVGKTTLLRNFGKECYRNMVELNFDDHPKLKRLFKRDLDPKRIVRDICLELNTEIIPGETLLFFDEIQDCPDALNSLKYFRENANEYHVCGAGSLLGVKLSHTKGFPVGQVHFEKLFPLSFFEFLDALNETRLKDYLLSLTFNDIINESIHEKCLEYLKYYFLIGGMPEAINIYQETEQFDEVRKVHKDILRAYDLDFLKHAPTHLVIKITECFHSIGSQLSKENKKFIYSIIREGARARTYEEALQWLVEANLLNKTYQISTPKLPLIAYENSQYFKAYFCDTGLLSTLVELPINAVIDGNDLFQEFHGALTENFVAQEFVQHYERLHYWTSENRAEVDFVLQQEEFVYPLEVKSGMSNHKKSLMLYRDKYQPELSLRASPQNLDKQKDFINLPLYLIGDIGRLLSGYKK